MKSEPAPATPAYPSQPRERVLHAAHHAQQLLQLTRVVGPSWALFNSAFGLTSQGFAALLLQQVGGDSSRYVATVSTVESASSGLMIFLSPHIGRAVDTVGRRPMMVWAHCAVAASHALVCAFPSRRSVLRAAPPRLARRPRNCECTMRLQSKVK